MLGGTLFFVGLAAFFFFVYGRHQRFVTTKEIGKGTTSVVPLGD